MRDLILFAQEFPGAWQYSGWLQFGATGVLAGLLVWLVTRRVPDQEKSYREDLRAILSDFKEMQHREIEYRHRENERHEKERELLHERYEAERQKQWDEYVAAMKTLLTSKNRNGPGND